MMPKRNAPPARRGARPHLLSARDGALGLPCYPVDLRQPICLAAASLPVFVLVLVLGSAAHADEPGAADPSPPSRQQVAEWLAELDADSRRVRETAERRLVQSGPAVLPLLPPADDLPSAAARQALLRIVAAIEKEQTRLALQGTSVTLRGRRTLSEVAGELSKQTGNRVTVEDSAASQQVEVILEAALFWQALEKVAHAAGLTWRIESEAIVLERAAPGAPSNADVATTIAGPFRVRSQAAGLKPIVGSPGASLLRLEVELLAEPRLKPLFLAFEADGIQARASMARTDRTVVVPPFNPLARQEIPFDADGRASLRLDYRLERDRAPTDVSLSGEVSVEVATSRERFAFDNVLEQPRQVQQRGGLTVSLRAADLVRRGKDRSLEVRCTVQYERGGPAFESHRTWVFHNDAQIELSDGTTREHTGAFETIFQADGVVELVYRFSNVSADPGKLRFVYVAPTVVSRVPVSFELAGVLVKTQND